MNGYRPMPARVHASDAELMRRVADGSEESLGLLHRRFARLIVGLASQTLDRAAAEDIVQDVFLAVWRNAATFDPERGSPRAWILQIAHFRLLNELRRRSRQPELETDPEGHVLAGLPARDPGPAEAAAAEHRRATLQSAVDQLPPPQRAAIRLAFLDDLTHEQVAAELGPLCLLVALGVRYRSEHAALERYDRALSMVTASDSVNLRLGPVSGTPEEAHARYRGRPGVGIAVVTFSKLPPAPAGKTYQAWVRHGATWTSLGTARPDADGSARLIAESTALAALPDALEVTVEPRAGSAVPGGPVVLAWAP